MRSAVQARLSLLKTKATYNFVSGFCFLLTTQMAAEKKWGAGKREIEDQLLSILFYLEANGAKEKIYHLNSKIRNWHDIRKRAIIEAKQNMIDDDFSKFMQLIHQSHHWKISQTIRNFIKAVENSSIDFEGKQNWLEWAKQKEAWFNPLINAKDDLLDDSYKQKVFEKLAGETKTTNTYSWSPSKPEFNWFEYLHAPYKYW